MEKFKETKRNAKDTKSKNKLNGQKWLNIIMWNLNEFMMK